jgi:ribosomal protein S12 methylthiotransferase
LNKPAGDAAALKVYISTMGCPKNLVDSEASAAVLELAGCRVTSDPSGADVLMVGACSFLDVSWRDTVEEVERLAEFKQRAGEGTAGSPRLVLMGCLPRHRGVDLETALPDVDVFLPTGSHEKLKELAAEWSASGSGGGPVPGGRVLDGTGTDRFAAFENRVLFTPSHTAYVKIAEGCNRKCSFCAIPAIRGRQVTRPVDSIVREVEGLVGRGVKEITLLAQDIVTYCDGRRGLNDLVDEIVKTGIDWVRIFYLHPAGLNLEIVRKLFSHSSVVRYLEVPVQHCSDAVLSRMRRSHNRGDLENLLKGLRGEFPDVVVRSEVIAGFPGETEEQFEELVHFIEEFEFDSLGVFPYSSELGTEASNFADAVPEPLIHLRVDELTRVQEAVSFGVQSRHIGRVYPVLIDRECGADEESGGRYAGRFYGQALDIDGEVYVDSKDLSVGEFAQVEITESGLFDMKGKVVGGRRDIKRS